MYKDTSRLVAEACDSEASYIPFVRQYIDACKEYEGPKEAAAGMLKSLKRKSSAGGEKAKKKGKKDM